jgi:hypothetical protein
LLNFRLPFSKVRVADFHVSQLSRENDEVLGRALESARCD